MVRKAHTLYSNMAPKATFFSFTFPLIFFFYLSLFNLQVQSFGHVCISVCVCVYVMIHSEAFDTFKKKADENQSEKPNIH